MGNLFISWSGPRALKMAQILYEWVPQVIQAVEPWLSESDIDKGARWNEVLAKELENARLGIFCLTPENLTAPWLNFEAGALSKAIGTSLVCTYLFDLQPTDVPPPLAQFNHTKSGKDDTRKLIITINKALSSPIKNERTLDKAFETYWPELQDRLVAVPKPTEEQVPRDEGEMVREILELVRELARQPLLTGRPAEWVAPKIPPQTADSTDEPFSLPLPPRRVRKPIAPDDQDRLGSG
jgi:hypothetical protein